jgi:hypothetical protein
MRHLSFIRGIFYCGVITIISISVVTAQKQKELKVVADWYTPTTYQEIMQMHQTYRQSGNQLPSPDCVRIESNRISQLKHRDIFAIIGLKNGQLDVDILVMSATNIPTQQALERRFNSDHHYPSNLDGFPLVIKMDKNAFDTIFKYTKCKYFLFFPCIENVWKQNGQVVDHNHKIHFTVGVLGSRPNNDSISILHTGGSASDKNFDVDKARKLDEALKGAETWPYESFEWAPQISFTKKAKK